MGKTIEDIINMWSEQLERNADTFTKEAVKGTVIILVIRLCLNLHFYSLTVVSMWDSELMESQKKLGDIAGDIRRIQVSQKELDTNLDTIFAYQMELKSTLEQLENSVDKMYEAQDQMPVAADIEREQTLQLSVDIDEQLNSMTNTLKEIVEKLNKAQSDSIDENNPVVQIMKVLNVHHNSLQWVEGSANRLNKEIAQVAKKLEGANFS
jgi:nuclear pore complex protein Nup62